VNLLQGEQPYNIISFSFFLKFDFRRITGF
jgi:hypothetical protein